MAVNYGDRDGRGETRRDGARMGDKIPPTLHNSLTSFANLGMSDSTGESHVMIYFL
jgi:hypothetical protein